MRRSSRRKEEVRSGPWLFAGGAQIAGARENKHHSGGEERTHDKHRCDGHPVIGFHGGVAKRKANVTLCNWTRQVVCAGPTVPPVVAVPLFRFLFNLLWFVLGGLVMGLGWWLAGLLCAISVVGLPWARSCFVIGNFSFWPFGQEAISRQTLTGRRDWGTGPLGTLGNVIWFLVAGWWLAIGHLASALACFLTVVGIPFGLQHIKLAQIALAPVGMTVVPKR